MAETVGDLRPRVDTFEGDGWRLRVVDAPGIAAVAADRTVELLHGARLPAPVRRARLSAGPGAGTDQPAYLLEAGVHSGGRVPDRSFALGNDPLGVLLSRRIEAGDARAARLGAGLETAVTGVFRRLGMPPPVGDRPAWRAGEPLHSLVDVDGPTGLRTTVLYHAPAAARGTGRMVTLRATVPAGGLSAARLAAFFAALMRVVAELSGGTPAITDPTGSAPGTDPTSSAPGTDPTSSAPGTDPTGGAPTNGGAVAGRGGTRSYVLGRQPQRGPGGAAGTDRVDLDQVGGLDDVVARFREIAVSFRHPGVMARWGARRPQGVLLYGPPGTGKTMLARALATEIGGGLREIRTPEILDKWLGASERNIKRVFQEARRFREPTVLLFDEFDSIIGYAGAGEDSGSRAVNAVAGIFKQEMNGLIDENPLVIVVATTNFPEMIDDSLIRAGRFDMHLEIPLPDAAGRAQIISRMIGTLMAEHEVAGFRMFADDVDITTLAGLTDGMSGADLREVFRRAQMAKAMREARTGAPAAPIDHNDLRECVRRLR